MNQPRHLVAASVKELTNPGAAFKFNYVCRNFLLRVKVMLECPMTDTAFPTGITSGEGADTAKHLSEMAMKSGIRVPASCSFLVASDDSDGADMLTDMSSCSEAPTVKGLQFNWAKTTEPDPSSTALLAALRKQLLAGPNKVRGGAERGSSGASGRSAALPPAAPKKKRGKGGGAKGSWDPLRTAASKSVRGVHTPAVQHALADAQAAAAEAILEASAGVESMEPYYTVRAVPLNPVWVAGGVAVIVEFPFTLNDWGPAPRWLIKTKKITTHVGAGGTYATSFQLLPEDVATDPSTQQALGAQSASTDPVSQLPIASVAPLHVAPAAPVFRLFPESGSRRPSAAAVLGAPTALLAPAAPAAPAAPDAPAATAVPAALSAGETAVPHLSSQGDAPASSARALTPGASGAAAPSGAAVVPVSEPASPVRSLPVAGESLMDGALSTGDDCSSPFSGSTAPSAAAGTTAEAVADGHLTRVRAPLPSPAVALVFPPPPHRLYSIGGAVHDAVMSVMGLNNDDLNLGPNDTLMMMPMKSSPPPPTSGKIIFTW